MTRAECEAKIKVKLNDIREILCEYSESYKHINIVVSPDYVSAFRIVGEPINEKPTYDIDIVEFFKKDVI